MKVFYNIGVDGWTEHSRGDIELSLNAWKILSKEWTLTRDRVISCQAGFTETYQLLRVAQTIDRLYQEEKDKIGKAAANG